MRTSFWVRTFGLYSRQKLWLAGGFTCLKWAWMLFPLVEEQFCLFTLSPLVHCRTATHKGKKRYLSLSTPWRHTGVSTATSPYILNLRTKWGRVVNFTPQLLYSLGKNPGTHSTGHWVRPSTGLSFPYWDLNYLSSWCSEEILKIRCHYQLFH